MITPEQRDYLEPLLAYLRPVQGKLVRLQLPAHQAGPLQTAIVDAVKILEELVGT